MCGVLCVECYVIMLCPSGMLQGYVRAVVQSVILGCLFIVNLHSVMCDC